MFDTRAALARGCLRALALAACVQAGTLAAPTATASSVSQASPARLTVSGSQLLASGRAFIPRGYNWGESSGIAGQDAAANAGQGANSVRLVFLWYVGSGPTATDCGGKGDGYSPGSPGNIDPKVLTNLDQQVQWATSAKLYTFIAMRGGDCLTSFYSSTVQAQWLVMLKFLAARYASTPYVAAYEPLVEPNLPAGGATQLLAAYQSAVAAVQSGDPAAIGVIGAARNYDVRALSTVYCANCRNVAYTANFYELGAYVHQAPPPTLGYPGTYKDGGASACAYPGQGTTVVMNKTFLAGLLGCATSFSAAHHVPVYIDQIGVPTSTPGALQYDKDVLSLINNDGLGFLFWNYRMSYKPQTGYVPGGDNGVMWQDSSGAWFTKSNFSATVGCAFKGYTC